jgi:hypothetical protein
MADRVAARVKKEPLGRGRLKSMADAIRGLEVVIRWCDTIAGPLAPVGRGR